jgi:hypothetical protein
MATAENAKLEIETGRSLKNYELMTDYDHTYFTASEDIWSGYAGYEPIVRPNGLITGGVVTPAVSGTNDKIDTSALTCYLIGVLTSVNASADATVLRGADANVCRINSVQVTAAGAISIVSGTAHTAFSEVRGASGGPPAILVGSIEIAQVRLSATAAAAVLATEIYAVIGQHCERYDYPVFDVNNIGQGAWATNAAAINAYVKFQEALPLSHTGPVCKRVYIKYHTPSFATVARCFDFKPVENTHSVSSTQYYGGTVGSRAASIGQGGFTALLNTGIADDVIKAKDQVVTVRFYPDRLKTQYVLTQGALGITRTFPVAAQIQAAVTLSAETVSADFET